MNDPIGGRPAAGASRRDIIRAAVRKPARALRRTGADGTALPHIAPVAREEKRAGRPAPVFVSYARSDMGLVGLLVDGLRAHGVAVTWDQDLPAGIDFQYAIRDAIDAAPAVIVVWSAMSVGSLYVGDEARRALDQRKLVTTHVEGFDFRDLPLGFGRLNAIPVRDGARLARSLADYGIGVAPGFAGVAAVTVRAAG